MTILELLQQVLLLILFLWLCSAWRSSVLFHTQH